MTVINYNTQQGQAPLDSAGESRANGKDIPAPGPPSGVMIVRTIPPSTFGDDFPMETADLDLLLRLAEEGAVDVEWKEGDLVLLDNYAVMHSRQPWKGERQVLAALWDDTDRIEDFPAGVELLKSSPRVPITA
ncbi:Fc.00g043100.m01.CDS01 [Cosmosporella sp. VM-42]